MSEENTLLFIYGTLKRGATNHAVLAGQNFLGEACSIAGYRLYVVADYPGLVSDPADTRGVTGELWSVTPAALARLDAFEGLPEKLYRRDRIGLSAPYDTTEAQTYFYLRNTRGRRPIVSGVWPIDGKSPS